MPRRDFLLFLEEMTSENTSLGLGNTTGWSAMERSSSLNSTCSLTPGRHSPPLQEAASLLKCMCIIPFLFFKMLLQVFSFPIFFCLSESYYIALAVMKLTMKTRLALNLEICLPLSEIKGMPTTPEPKTLFWLTCFQALSLFVNVFS